MIAAARSPTSPRPATTTRFITDERAATRRSSAPPAPGDVSEMFAQILPSSAATPSIVRARECQRSTGWPGVPGAGAIGPSTRRVMPAPAPALAPAPVPTSEPPPAPSVALDEVGGGIRAPRAGGVVREVRGGAVEPGVMDRVDDAPRCLDLVRSGEQRLVAQHRVEDQGFVRVRRVRRESG